MIISKLWASFAHTRTSNPVFIISIFLLYSYRFAIWSHVNIPTENLDFPTAPTNFSPIPASFISLSEQGSNPSGRESSACQPALLLLHSSQGKDEHGWWGFQSICSSALPTLHSTVLSAPITNVRGERERQIYRQSICRRNKIHNTTVTSGSGEKTRHRGNSYCVGCRPRRSSSG